MTTVVERPGSPLLTPTGDDRWDWDIDESAPLPEISHDQKPGVYLGAYDHPKEKKTYWLRETSDRHVLLAAPTRAGKGVSFAVPNALTWPESLVVHDLKGELWRLTARYRAEKLGNLVFRFDPTCNDGTGACWNPLFEIRLGTDYEVADTQNIATLVVDPEGKGINTGENAHWARTARSFLTGVILHVLYYEENKTMQGVDAFLSDTRRTQMEIFERMLKAEHDPHLKRGWIDDNGDPTATHPMAARVARDMIERSEGERTSVLSSVKSYLDLYRDEIVAKNTYKSDFSINDLMHADRPVTLYIVNMPSDMDRLMPLTRLIINFVLRTFTRKVEYDADGRPVKNFKHALLIIMDEFTALRHLAIFASALSFLAGFGIRVMIIVQDFVQLVEVYGDAGARGIMANMHIKIFYAPGDPKTAELFSGMLGKMTVRVQNKSTDSRGKTSWSEHLEAIEMLTPDQFLTLSASEAVIHITNQPPISCGRITYYQERLLKERVLAEQVTSNVIPVEQQAGTIQLLELRKLADEQARIKLAKLAEKRRQERELESSFSASFKVLSRATSPEAVTPAPVVVTPPVPTDQLFEPGDVPASRAASPVEAMPVPQSAASQNAPVATPVVEPTTEQSPLSTLFEVLDRRDDSDDDLY